MRSRIVAAVLLATVVLGAGGAALAQPCLIFVHGKRTTTETYDDWNAARAYWVGGGSDFIDIATRNFQTSYYVVGHDGTQPWWNVRTASEVAREILLATDGVADGGGNRCARTWSEGGIFYVIAHSMGATIMDFLLGNADPTDPNHHPVLAALARRVSVVITLGGAHRGSEAADAVCGESTPFCNALAGWLPDFLAGDCSDATFWLRSADAVQVRTYANSPARSVMLTGGFEAIIGLSLCLSGEDDGLVQYASQYACGGSATASYDNTDVCGNGAKQESFGFRNIDAAFENHADEKTGEDPGERRAIPDGVWKCDGAPCAPDTVVQTEFSSAQLVRFAY